MWELVSFMASLIAFGLLMTVGYSVALYLPAWLKNKMNIKTGLNDVSRLEKRIESLEAKILIM